MATALKSKLLFILLISQYRACFYNHHLTNVCYIKINPLTPPQYLNKVDLIQKYGRGWDKKKKKSCNLSPNSFYYPLNLKDLTPSSFQGLWAQDQSFMVVCYVTSAHPLSIFHGDLQLKCLVWDKKNPTCFFI